MFLQSHQQALWGMFPPMATIRGHWHSAHLRAFALGAAWPAASWNGLGLLVDLVGKTPQPTGKKSNQTDGQARKAHRALVRHSGFWMPVV